MKKKPSRVARTSERDTLRPEYDFRGASRGATAKRYRASVNIVAIDADLADLFPDAASVNDALRALAGVIRARVQRRKRSR